MNSILNSPERRASDVLFDEIFASRNGNRRSNIRVIKDICDQMERDGVPINAAEVTRRCGDDGPAYSTVSNKGSKLGEYIKLRIVEQASKLVPRKGPGSCVADSISDPVLAAQVRDKEASARWLAKENAGLRSLLKSLTPGFDIDAALSRAGKGQALLPTSSRESREPAVSEELRAALLKLMDHLVRERLYEIHRGRLTINRKSILDPRELEVYRRTCNLTENEWAKRYGCGEATIG